MRNGSDTSQSGGGQSQSEDRVGFLKYGEDSDGSGSKLIDVVM